MTRAPDTDRRADAAALAGLAAIVLLLYHALLTRHALQVHDSLDTYLRADGYLRELRAGHIPPQLFPEAISGGGYALPRFYPPFGYLVAAALAAPTEDPVLGVHLALLLSVIASAWAMYYLIRLLTGRPGLGLLGALLYATFPYRFTDALQRSAVAESWTFVWFPLLFAGAWQAIRSGRVPWYFALSVAGLLLTHTTTALYFAVVCASIALLARRQVPMSTTARLTAEGLAGVAMAAWFLLPQGWYLPTVWASDARFMWATPQFADNNRLTLDLLVHRFSAPNGLDLGVGVLGATVPIVALIAWRRRGVASELDPRVVGLGWALGFTWVAVIAFMLAPLPALLVLPTPFAYIQFPWRLLGLAGFLAATAVTLMTGSLGPISRRVAALLAAGALAAAVLPASYRRVPTMEWRSAEIVAIGLGSYGEKGYTILGEYLPRGEPADSVNASVREGLRGSDGVHPLSWRRIGEGWVAEVEVVAREGEVVLPLVAYDVYRIVDERGRVVSAEPWRGVLRVRLDQGRHTLRVTRRRTAVELAGIGLTLAGVVGYAMLRRA